MSSRLVALLSIAALAPAGVAQQGYSIDPASPEVPGTFSAADFVQSNGVAIDYTAVELGLNPAVDVIAISDTWDQIDGQIPPTCIAPRPAVKNFYYSVDRGTVGIPGQVVAAQAGGNGAAGDKFQLDLFCPFPGPPDFWLAPVLVCDAPACGLSALPGQSDIDALDLQPPGPRAANARGMVMSLAGGGPVLFYQPAPGAGAGAPVQYANAAQLGLLPGDEIDALAIFDFNPAAGLNPGDTVYVSLTNGSPTLAGLGATGADVLMVAPVGPVIIVPAANFGLQAGDELNALTISDPGATFSSTTEYGGGCYDAPRMVYERFSANTPIDLVNTSWTLLYTANSNGGHYVITPGGAPYDAASAAANGVDLTATPPHASSSNSWDDGSVVMMLGPAFAGGFPLPSGNWPPALQITVNSNGRLYLGRTYSSTHAATGGHFGHLSYFQGSAGPGLPMLAPFFCDLDPTAGGRIWYEDPSPGGGVRITWAGVPNWQQSGGPPAVLNDIQVELLPSGQVTFAYGTRLGNGGVINNVAITGYSPGAAEPFGPLVDWSTLNGFVTGDGRVAPRIGTDAPPRIGTTINVELDTMPSSSQLAAVLYGLTRYDPGLPLAGFGMPDCFQHTSPDSVAIVFPFGGVASTPFTIPNVLALGGLEVYSQGAVLDSAGGHNAQGVLMTAGLTLKVGAL